MLNIKVIPNAKENSVIEEKGRLRVRVKAKAADGKANRAVIKTLADFFKVKKSAIQIVKGEKSRNKIIKIE